MKVEAAKALAQKLLDAVALAEADNRDSIDDLLPSLGLARVDAALQTLDEGIAAAEKPASE